jgi:hypothetical protein
VRPDYPILFPETGMHPAGGKHAVAHPPPTSIFPDRLSASCSRKARQRQHFFFVATFFFVAFFLAAFFAISVSFPNTADRIEDLDASASWLLGDTKRPTMLAH